MYVNRNSHQLDEYEQTYRVCSISLCIVTYTKYTHLCNIIQPIQYSTTMQSETVLQYNLPIYEVDYITIKSTRYRSTRWWQVVPNYISPMEKKRSILYITRKSLPVYYLVSYLQHTSGWDYSQIKSKTGSQQLGPPTPILEQMGRDDTYTR